MQLQINIIGGLLIALSLVHVIFPKYFSWKKELAQLSLINRQIMQVHTFFIALTVFMIGLLCLTSAHDIITTTLGKRIALGLSVFWGIRLIIQFFGYSSKLWRGKIFETIAHIIFSLLWVYLTATFWIVSQV